VPDIGPARAKSLVDAFSTIEAIAAASVKDSRRRSASAR
jgi:excinuclease UvrABC nuclease subunit